MHYHEILFCRMKEVIKRFRKRAPQISFLRSVGGKVRPSAEQARHFRLMAEMLLTADRHRALSVKSKVADDIEAAAVYSTSHQRK